ncbi:MAG: hypothetical protein V1649_02250 [Patescibacteria group bacterium]
MTQKLICMTQKKLLGYDVIKNLMENKINGTDAAKQIGLSIRQTKRVKAKVKKYGAVGLIHSSRGKSNNRKLSDYLIEKQKK